MCCNDSCHSSNSLGFCWMLLPLSKRRWEYFHRLLMPNYSKELPLIIGSHHYRLLVIRFYRYSVFTQRHIFSGVADLCAPHIWDQFFLLRLAVGKLGHFDRSSGQPVYRNIDTLPPFQTTDVHSRHERLAVVQNQHCHILPDLYVRQSLFPAPLHLVRQRLDLWSVFQPRQVLHA